MSDDPRVDALRYVQEREDDEPGQESGLPQVSSEKPAAASTPDAAPTPAQVSSYVEQSVQQAIRAGAFDNLPGAGKPLPPIVSSRDPDWWIRNKIASERITGLAPDAFRLRTEHAEFAARMDELRTEKEVRAAVADFNRRVIEARRQLLGGPPVVTPLRDADDEVRAWHSRRAAAE